MFERDASLALSDAKFLISKRCTIFHLMTVSLFLTDSEEQQDVEVDESLFQDLGDLEDEEDS